MTLGNRSRDDQVRQAVQRDCPHSVIYRRATLRRHGICAQEVGTNCSPWNVVPSSQPVTFQFSQYDFDRRIVALMKPAVSLNIRVAVLRPRSLPYKTTFSFLEKSCREAWSGRPWAWSRANDIPLIATLMLRAAFSRQAFDEQSSIDTLRVFVASSS